MSRNYSPDQVLVDRLTQNDTEAFEELYRLYWHSLFSYSYNKLRSVEEARKIVRTIFIHLWESRTSIPSSFSLSNYLYTNVREEVVKSLNDRLESVQKEEVSHSLLEEFTAKALQKSKEPSIRKYDDNRITELKRQQVLHHATKEDPGIYMNVKWLINAIASKKYS